MHSKSFETFAELIGLETCIGYLVMRTELKQRFMVKKWLVPRMNDRKKCRSGWATNGWEKLDALDEPLDYRSSGAVF
jgi:hypothetical protein